MKFLFFVIYLFQKTRTYGSLCSLAGNIPLGIAAIENLPK